MSTNCDFYSSVSTAIAIGHCSSLCNAFNPTLKKNPKVYSVHVPFINPKLGNFVQWALSAVSAQLEQCLSKLFENNYGFLVKDACI